MGYSDFISFAIFVRVAGLAVAPAQHTEHRGATIVIAAGAKAGR